MCQDGWGGNWCDIPLCRIPCLFGNCTSKDTCTCEALYSGATCDTGNKFNLKNN